MWFVSESRSQEAIPSPVTKRLEWKGKDWGFYFYDKEARQKVDFDLSEFVLIKTGYQFKGWSDSANSSVSSNEIDEWDDNMRVFHFWGEQRTTTIAEGVWRDIKPQVEGLGKINIVLTGIVPNGDIVTITFKGAAYKEFNDFADNFDAVNNKIKFGEPQDKKTGAVSYKVPTFEDGGAVTAALQKKVDSAIDELKEYYAKLDERYGTSNAEDNSNDTVIDDDDDLPF